MSKRNKALIALAVTVVILVGLYQVDLVRQQVEIAVMRITGTQWTLRGKLIKSTVYSPALRQQRRVYIYLPPGYFDPSNAGMRYPALYLLHGSPDLNAISWVPYGRAPQLVDKLIVAGKIPPMIVVCPDGHGPGTYGDSEYIDAPDPRVAGKPGTQVATFIAKDLVDYIDTNYRTIATPAGRWIGGVSTGGYGAVNLGLHNPEVFGTIVSLSGYFAADPSGDARPVWGYHPSQERLYFESPNEYLGSGNPSWAHEFVFLGAGANERGAYRAEAANFAQKLSAAGIPYMIRTRPGKHSWDLWRELLQDALLQLKSRIPGQAVAQ